ncbi:MAG: hypothetical protein AAF409_05635 [Pseudomonadota bacterium]
MKAFLLACIAMAIITVGADLALDRVGFSSEEVFQRDAVRLGD